MPEMHDCSCGTLAIESMTGPVISRPGGGGELPERFPVQAQSPRALGVRPHFALKSAEDRATSGGQVDIQTYASAQGLTGQLVTLCEQFKKAPNASH